MRARVDIQLRWGDEDSYGHINNVAYARYLEEARGRILGLGVGHEPTGLEKHFGGGKVGKYKTLVANQVIEFLRVLEYSEHPITVEMWIGKLGGASLELHYEILEGGERERTVVARAITTLVIVDGHTLKPARLEGDARASVEAWMDEPLSLRRE